MLLYDGLCQSEVADEEPFDAYDDETRYEQLERRADSIRSHRRVPRAFAAAVDAYLEPDPTERPTIKDLTQTLNELAQPPSS